MDYAKVHIKDAMETQYLLVQGNRKKEFEKKTTSCLNGRRELLGDVAIHAVGKGTKNYNKSLIFKYK